MLGLVDHLYRVDPRSIRLSSLGGPFDDPGLFLEPMGSGEAVLIDCGDLRGLPVAKALKIGWMFLTHLHIDHLIGFDQLLRVRLFSPTPLRVFGPPGTVRAIRHRLQGYAWNLTSGSPFRVEAYDLAPDRSGPMDGAVFRCHTQFRKERLKEHLAYQPEVGLTLTSSAPGLKLRALTVEHGVPCLAFLLEQSFPPKVRLEALKEWAVPPGPWLSDLVAGRLPEFEIAGELRTREWLQTRFLTPSSPFRFAYLTDTRMTPPLREKLSEALWEFDLLCSESAYLEVDRGLAEKNLHLTARQVAELAKDARCRYLGLFHFSRRYIENGPDEHLEQARAWFPQTYLLSQMAPPLTGESQRSSP